jgi:hypothetical protein
MSRKLLWLLLPVLAVGTPPVLYNAKDWWAQAKQRVAPLLSLSTGPQAGGGAPGVAAGPQAPSDSSPSGAVNNIFATADTARRSADTPTQLDLADVIRFDVSPGWVLERWPWISAGLSRLPLQGYRVPLVTGTASDDLVGSLTYYFNAQQKLQQITFEGATGDGNKLLRLLIGRYRFGRRLTNDPGLFRYEVPAAKGPATSFLNVRLVQPNDPYRRFHVELVIERPDE